jgi:hypothetical protein
MRFSVFPSSWLMRGEGSVTGMAMPTTSADRQPM